MRREDGSTCFPTWKLLINSLPYQFSRFERNSAPSDFESLH